MAKKKIRFSLSRLEHLAEYWRCSIRQRFFLQTLLQGLHDGIERPEVFATQSAYNVTPKSARVFSYQLLQKPKILAVLKIFGVGPMGRKS
jgi:hypothetical protein